MSLRLLVAAVSAALMLTLASPIRAVGGEASFLSGVEDLPLMEGLAEAPEAGSVFDTPSGRIVEAYCEGVSVTWAQVAGFYAATLPQLGWTEDKANTYRREGEVLRIELLGRSRPITVRFTVAPE